MHSENQNIWSICPFFPKNDWVCSLQKGCCKVTDDVHGSIFWRKKGRGEDYFRHKAKTRRGEKRRKARWESRERLEEEEKRRHHMWGEREAESKVRGWGCGGRDRGTHGTYQWGYRSVHPAHVCCPVPHLFASSTWDGFPCCSFSAFECVIRMYRSKKRRGAKKEGKSNQTTV